MAKKAVATLLKTGSKNFTKVILSVRSERTGAYTFKETIVTSEEANMLLDKKD